MSVRRGSQTEALRKPCATLRRPTSSLWQDLQTKGCVMRRFILLLGLCGLSMAGVLTASASAALTAPVVTTGSATTPTPTATTLSGTVNPVGQATTYHFDYGTTISYGSTTTDTSAGSGILGRGLWPSSVGTASIRRARWSSSWPTSAPSRSRP